MRNSALARSSMRSINSDLDQNKVDSIVASGRKSMVNTMLLTDAKEAQAEVQDAKRVLTFCGSWLGFPVTNNTKALFVMMVMFTVITLGQYFAAAAVGSQALKADVVSMGVDAVSYFGNICGECPKYPAQRIVTQLLFSLISLALLVGFNTQIIMESIDMLKNPEPSEDSYLEGIIVIVFAGLGLVFDFTCLFFYRHFALKQAKEDYEAALAERNALKAVPEGGEGQETAAGDDADVKLQKPEVNMLSALLHVSADLFRSTSTFILGILMVSGALTEEQQAEGDTILAIIISSTIYLGAIYAIYEWIIAARKWFYALADVDMGALEEKGGAADAILG